MEKIINFVIIASILILGIHGSSQMAVADVLGGPVGPTEWKSAPIPVNMQLDSSEPNFELDLVFEDMKHIQFFDDPDPPRTTERYILEVNLEVIEISGSSTGITIFADMSDEFGNIIPRTNARGVMPLLVTGQTTINFQGMAIDPSVDELIFHDIHLDFNIAPAASGIIQINSIVIGFQADKIEEGVWGNVAVGGEMFPVDTTALLLAATYSTASWMIPLMIAAVGFGIIITHQKTKLKHNSCPSCKLETDDFFELGDKVVSKCDNPKCRVNLFFIRRYRNSFK